MCTMIKNKVVYDVYDDIVTFIICHNHIIVTIYMPISYVCIIATLMRPSYMYTVTVVAF